MDELPPTNEPMTQAETVPMAPTASASIVESIANRFSRSSTTSSQASTTTSKPALPPRNSSSAEIVAPPPPLPPPVPPKTAPPRRSPFSWLRSSSNNSPAVTPPPLPPPPPPPQSSSRRATASSIATVASLFAPSAVATQMNSELLLNRMESNRGDEKEKDAVLRGTQTLKESFRRLREARERAAVASDDENAKEVGSRSSVSSTAAIGTGMGSSPAPEDSTIPGSNGNQEEEIDWDLWQAVVDDSYKVAAEKPSELNRAIQAGIPPTLRGTVWQSMAASKSLELESAYQDLEKVIKRDLGERTSFGKYKVDQKALMGVCKAYALFDPEVGYTQGMTFIATVLLLNMAEEEAFCVFVKLMNKYKLRTMFQEKMKGLELRLFQYDRILEDYQPRLAIHLKRQGIESSLYAAQWFLTLFTYKFPLQLVLRVFDLLFSEGLEGPILKFGIVLMGKNAETLIGMGFDTLGPFLKERLFDVYLDTTPSATSVKEAGFFGNGGEKDFYRANQMVQDACAVKITQDMLDRYEGEWDEIMRAKREHDMELDTLRRMNASLMIKVKGLEEQNEELNREYVRIASSEVGLKVQNDQLADENEVLKAKVEGLKEIVDKQPQEIEQRFKEEMDKLMTRNLEVHTENQNLEESMLEMEKDLVGTKMQLATVNEDYDLLKNRWHDLRKALGD
ncbi:RabGAP/TBC [Choiromyces venosus 120613-1]|uniref:GTPase-activating protein GYP5 n=1 Tax=Choiromyces venosus 120613-1 TaxID=1336337 RepID=A0A3N4JUS3_9PEZI|nr:RabGAP/TBC [Choiromyces venosus 120613-1]